LGKRKTNSNNTSSDNSKPRHHLPIIRAPLRAYYLTMEIYFRKHKATKVRNLCFLTMEVFCNKFPNLLDQVIKLNRSLLNLSKKNNYYPSKK